MHLTGGHFQVDAVQGPHTRKRLDDAAHDKERSAGQGIFIHAVPFMVPGVKVPTFDRLEKTFL
ncbi:hypothetical protein GCM10009780_39690 [Actinomadura alba]